ncbi:hypothetical protein Rhe02_70090 [Rhizocola hellebori]|uniref:Uncharacterized protein n=1 Tax=Rhizocola hellebori TaxID=1392758 RepID=A0A8J3QF97_9ACTN|nr:hypothetical protein [Rhizocola hellebori]GIH08942.1 hypothetical protein Rhe02_70090 [Rhizocola hellebori]
MRKPLVLAAFALVSAAGAVIVALPDSGPRLEISQAHGPGIVDLAGIALLLSGSGILWWYLWTARASLSRSPARLQHAWIFGTGLGAGLILASVANDFAGWWAIGATALLAVQLSLFATAKP